MPCCICGRAECQVGVLCEGCRDSLRGPVPITGEQIHGSSGTPSPAALIDVWGGVHRLSPDTLVGRAPESEVLSIYEASVSRRHARLWCEDGLWTVIDLESANGTFVDVQPAREPLPVRTGNRVRFGDVSFFFIADASELVQSLPPLAGQTVRPVPQVKREPEVPVKLSEPSGGGGGVVEIAGKSVHLTLAQYELVSRLIARRVEDADQPASDRGFITSDQLATVLSLDSLQPNDDNVRQLVRRVRRRLLEAGIGDIIESKYGFGYRLNITPRLR